MNEQKEKPVEINFSQGISGKINPHEVMGGFVYTYETLIKPAIQGGNLLGATGAILDVCIRFGEVEKQIGKMKRGSYAPYRMALTYLRGLADRSAREELGNKGLEIALQAVDRQVAELDGIMHGNEVYEKHRQRPAGEKQ